MPTSNSTVRKRRRGNYVYPTDESWAARYAANSREKEEAEREEAQAAGAGAKAEYKDDAMDDAGAIDDKTGTAARAGAKAEDEDEEMEEAELIDDEFIQLTQMLEASLDDGIVALDDNMEEDHEEGEGC